MILLDADLQKFGVDVESKDYKDEDNDKLKYIFKKRNEMMMKS
jgi:hypothetical protein